MTITHDNDTAYGIYNSKDNLIGYINQVELDKVNFNTVDIKDDKIEPLTTMSITSGTVTMPITSPNINYSSVYYPSYTFTIQEKINSLVSILNAVYGKSKLKRVAEKALIDLINTHI